MVLMRHVFAVMGVISMCFHLQVNGNYFMISALSTVYTPYAVRPTFGSEKLAHDFEIVSSTGAQRNSIKYENQQVLNVFDVKTAKRQNQPFLAIDIQDVPQGFASSTPLKRILDSKLDDIPPCLQEKGILLVGQPKDYELSEIQQLSNASWNLKNGQFAVIAKLSRKGFSKVGFSPTWALWIKKRSGQIKSTIYDHEFFNQMLNEIPKMFYKNFKYRCGKNVDVN